ncbi:Hsp20/alpha crystallin family protein [Stutzerimonas kirkiae]|nr:Hsp20/alpha crystallin family protein [Stutzerimonas kirkiae]
MTDKDKKLAKEQGAPSHWHPLLNLRKQIDRLFDDYDHTPGLLPLGKGLFDSELFLGRPGTPAVDIVEQDQAFVISAELPGLDEQDIEVKLSGRDLSISAEKKDERDEQKKGYHLSERRYGRFERRFTLPAAADADAIEANFAKGVLTLTLPKKPEALASERRIEVKRSE